MKLLICADARQIPLQDKSVNCCVTSPPYWDLRDYGVAGQLGLERTPEEYIAAMLEVFREVKRVLRDDGTLWLNMGDSYATSTKGSGGGSEKQRSNTGSRFDVLQHFDHGLKSKDLVGIPWMLAFALRADGWYLRSDIIWSKPNPMPESVTDRPTKAHEYIFLLSKSERYYYNAGAIAEESVDPEGTASRYKYAFSGRPGLIMPDGKEQQIAPKGMRVWGGHRSAHMEDTPRNDGERWRIADGGVAPRGERNKRSVWTVTTNPFPEAHFATFPEELVKPCILAGCPAGGTVLDPFIGSGTTALVAESLQCNAIGIELNPGYIEIAKKRLTQNVLDFQDAVK